MVDKLRWRYHERHPVVAAVDSATVIEISDLLWQDTDDAKPASMLLKELDLGTDRLGSGADVSTAELQEKFADKFLGVAMQRSRNGDTVLIRVATTGVFEFECSLRRWELGVLVGIPPNDTGRLQDQAVVEVTNKHFAIGRVAKREAHAVSGVLVAVCSTVMTGGIVGR